jgi:hypothetical protein
MRKKNVYNVQILLVFCRSTTLLYKNHCYNNIEARWNKCSVDHENCIREIRNDKKKTNKIKQKGYRIKKTDKKPLVFCALTRTDRATRGVRVYYIYIYVCVCVCVCIKVCIFLNKIISKKICTTRWYNAYYVLRTRITFEIHIFWIYTGVYYIE